MTVLVYAYVRASYAWHQFFHRGCEKRAIQQFHAGYIRGAQDERSVIGNAKLEAELRDVIAQSEDWGADPGKSQRW